MQNRIFPANKARRGLKVLGDKGSNLDERRADGDSSIMEGEGARSGLRRGQESTLEKGT